MSLLLQQPVVIRLTFREKSEFIIKGEDKITILELSSFLYDFSLLHDCIALSALPDYESYNFGYSFWYRKGRKLKKEHQLYLNKINHNSPLALEVIIPATAAALGIPWLILQAIDKIQNWQLNREKLKLDVDNLRLEKEKKEIEQIKQTIELDNIIRKRETIEIFNRIISRIEQSQLTATDIDITYFEHDKNDNDKKQKE